ncbi:hypothetical protein CZ771_14580 [Actinomycetales bacterium JB111]|nr:hypothetical protein CZ771_14580 [Actinomycetales bacterium JB111]
MSTFTRARIATVLRAALDATLSDSLSESFDSSSRYQRDRDAAAQRAPQFF